MGNELKGALFRALKEHDVPLAKHYREYTVAELQLAYDALAEALQLAPITEATAVREFEAPRESRAPAVPRSHRDPNEMAGQRVNTKEADEPIRVDPDTGYIWYQEEVTKPSYPKPRGRRKLTYTETGIKTVQAKNGEYTETFEVAGDEVARTSEVKVTLPSFQVGCYKDPRFPFKIHVYSERRGFDLFDIEQYYGGRELVPEDVKRIYVENVLCYDIPSVTREIQTTFRKLQLAGKLEA